MTKKKLSAGKVLLLLLLLLVIGALITAGICYFLASQDNIKDKYTLIYTAGRGAITRAPAVIL